MRCVLTTTYHLHYCLLSVLSPNCSRHFSFSFPMFTHFQNIYPCIYICLCRVSLQVGVCLGSKLESLALPGSSITEASLLALLPRLTSLRRLNLRGLDSLFMSGAFLSREEHRQQVFFTGTHTYTDLPEPRSDQSPGLHHSSATFCRNNLGITTNRRK